MLLREMFFCISATNVTAYHLLTFLTSLTFQLTFTPATLLNPLGLSQVIVVES